MENSQSNQIKKTKPDRLLGYTYICTCFRTSYLTIKLIRFNKTNELFLIKQYKKDFIRKNDKSNAFINEVDILKRVKGFGLVLTIKFPYLNKTSIDIVFDNFPLTNCFEKLMQKKEKLEIDVAKFYFACFLHLFYYLSEKNILFRNFTYSNCFIDPKNGYIKYINLDSCKILKDKNDFTYTLVGKSFYLSPEMINYSGYNYTSNYFVVGIILYEMLHGYNPFENSDPMMIYKNILTENYKEIKTDRDIKLLLKQLLTKDVKKRIGAGKRCINEITSHKCFMNFNWEDFSNRKMQAPFNLDFSNNYSIEEYYMREFENSPDLKNYLNMKDKPWKENEVNNFSLNQDNKSKEKDEEERIKNEYFKFMKEYEDF